MMGFCWDPKYRDRRLEIRLNVFILGQRTGSQGDRHSGFVWYRMEGSQEAERSGAGGSAHKVGGGGHGHEMKPSQGKKTLEYRYKKISTVEITLQTQ